MRDPFLPLLFVSVLEHQQQSHVVANDRMLGLEIVEQSQSLSGKVLPDDRHTEIGAVLATILFGQGIAVVPGSVGAAPRLAQQRFPLLVGQAAAVPVGACVLAAVIEEAIVVVLMLQRHDLALNELIKLGQCVRNFLGNVEIHGGLLGEVSHRYAMTADFDAYFVSVVGFNT